MKLRNVSPNSLFLWNGKVCVKETNSLKRYINNVVEGKELCSQIGEYKNWKMLFYPMPVDTVAIDEYEEVEELEVLVK